MLRLAADENLNSDIFRGLIRRKPHLDIVRIQDVGLSGAEDAEVLDWAAREGRVLLTHDHKHYASRLRASSGGFAYAGSI